ncbi:uncharacterized protein N7483_005770, partial [Penicillium malachiteum]|uniref:uncharacterized protein n=1 Tax=Penicillium malachiteum TaxID=1324776 RepID=UPI0025468778
MLAPNLKFQFFCSGDWKKETCDIYRDTFEKALLRCQEKLGQNSSKNSFQTGLTKRQANGLIAVEPHNEWSHKDSIEFWKKTYNTALRLVRLARVFLPVPASGGAVERFFDTARQASCDLNIPHCYSCLNPKRRPITEVFQKQFTYTFTTRFEFSPDQLKQYKILVAAPEEREILTEEDYMLCRGLPNVEEEFSGKSVILKRKTIVQ